MKKKPAIKDHDGSRVVIETIAAFKSKGSQDIKLSLRNGDRLNLHWTDKESAKKTLEILDNCFDIVN